jgi:hypothetical protein
LPAQGGREGGREEVVVMPSMVFSLSVAEDEDEDEGKMMF